MSLTPIEAGEKALPAQVAPKGQDSLAVLTPAVLMGHQNRGKLRGPESRDKMQRQVCLAAVLSHPCPPTPSVTQDESGGQA